MALIASNGDFPCFIFIIIHIYMHGRNKNDSEATQESTEVRTQKQTKKRKSTETVRVRFFGKIQIRILVSKNGFCVSLPKSENGLITD